MANVLITNVPDDLWNRIKIRIPRSMTINEYMINVIAEESLRLNEQEKEVVRI